MSAGRRFGKTSGTWCCILQNTPPEVLVPGTRVFVYETGQLEGEGIVQRGKRYDWVAEMIVETIRHPDDEGYTNGRGPDAAAEDEAAKK